MALAIQQNQEFFPPFQSGLFWNKLNAGWLFWFSLDYSLVQILNLEIDQIMRIIR